MYAPLVYQLSSNSVTQTGIPFETVYAELKRIAQGRLRGLPSGRTLHATVLVHEAYLKLIGVDFASGTSQTFNGKANGDANKPSQTFDRAAFFAAASEAMRRIVIDHYRRKICQKRGGRFQRLPIEPGQLPCEPKGRDLLEIEEALAEFEAIYPEKAQVVKLRFFVGMTMRETAQALEISISTTERHWRFARAWISENLE